MSLLSSNALLDLCFHTLQAQQASSNASKKSERKIKRDAEGENAEDYIDPETPFGEKKRLSRQMAKQYSPSAVENS